MVFIRSKHSSKFNSKNCNKILTMLIMPIFRCQKNIYHHSNWIFQNMFKMFPKPSPKLLKKSKRWRLWQFEITKGKYPYTAYSMHLFKIFQNKFREHMLMQRKKTRMEEYMERRNKDKRFAAEAQEKKEEKPKV